MKHTESSLYHGGDLWAVGRDGIINIKMYVTVQSLQVNIDSCTRSDSCLSSTLALIAFNLQYLDQSGRNSFSPLQLHSLISSDKTAAALHKNLPHCGSNLCFNLTKDRWIRCPVKLQTADSQATARWGLDVTEDVNRVISVTCMCSDPERWHMQIKDL